MIMGRPAGTSATEHMMMMTKVADGARRARVAAQALQSARPPKIATGEPSEHGPARVQTERGAGKARPNRDAEAISSSLCAADMKPDGFRAPAPASAVSPPTRLRDKPETNQDLLEVEPAAGRSGHTRFAVNPWPRDLQTSRPRAQRSLCAWRAQQPRWVISGWRSARRCCGDPATTGL